MTAHQSYHLTFARFSPSLSVRSFTASEAANTAYRVEITATSTDSSLPLSSYLNQRAAFEIRPQEAVLSEVEVGKTYKVFHWDIKPRTRADNPHWSVTGS